MNYKIFTIEEFNQRVKLFWNLMIKSEFPEWDCVPIQHDIQKRRTSNYGIAHHRRVDGKSIPIKLSFSYRMLDGRYTLEAVDDVIKHEVGHLLDCIRNGKGSGHGAPFKAIAKEFGFDATSTKPIEKSEIYDMCVRNESRYFLVCDCGYVKNSKRKPYWAIYMMKESRAYCLCPDCKRDDRYTLYIFPKGIETIAPEIDYEAYFGLFGGKSIRSIDTYVEQ